MKGDNLVLFDPQAPSLERIPVPPPIPGFDPLVSDYFITWVTPVEVLGWSYDFPDRMGEDEGDFREGRMVAWSIDRVSYELVASVEYPLHWEVDAGVLLDVFVSNTETNPLFPDLFTQSYDKSDDTIEFSTVPAPWNGSSISTEWPSTLMYMERLAFNSELFDQARQHRVFLSNDISIGDATIRFDLWPFGQGPDDLNISDFSIQRVGDPIDHPASEYPDMFGLSPYQEIQDPETKTSAGPGWLPAIILLAMAGGILVSIRRPSPK